MRHEERGRKWVCTCGTGNEGDGGENGKGVDTTWWGNTKQLAEL